MCCINGQLRKNYEVNRLCHVNPSTYPAVTKKTGGILLSRKDPGTNPDTKDPNNSLCFLCFNFHTWKTEMMSNTCSCHRDINEWGHKDDWGPLVCGVVSGLGSKEWGLETSFHRGDIRRPASLLCVYQMAIRLPPSQGYREVWVRKGFGKNASGYHQLV